MEIIHITLDCGAKALLIIPEECERLGLHIDPPSQLANGIDKSKLEVIGEIRTVFERGPLKLSFEALVTVIPHMKEDHCWPKSDLNQTNIFIEIRPKSDLNVTKIDRNQTMA